MSKKIQTVAGQTCLSEWKIREIVGLPFTEECPATTVEEAQEYFDRASCGSQAEKVAELKWDQLSLEEVEKATTPEQVLKAFEEAPNNQKAAIAAIKKLYELTPEEE